MGDVLPPKRQAVVERLRVRLERYRWHHNSCYPHYEQSANSLYDKEQQDTLRLKQRYLESKAKKAKNNKSDHHRAPAAPRESTSESQKLSSHSKLSKAVLEEPPKNATPEVPPENSDRSSKPLKCDNKISDFSKESVASNFALSSMAPYATFNQSTAPPSTISKENPLTPVTSCAANQASSNSSQKITIQTSKQNTQVEQLKEVKCKQEEDSNLQSLCQFKEEPKRISEDRLSDTFPSLGFAEDSSEDVIHPDILNDIIDDVFTNPTDIMKDFNFEDSVCGIKDGDKDDIDELVKASTSISQPFHSSNLLFATSTHQPGTSMFSSCSVTTQSSSASPAAYTVASSATTSTQYSSHQQQQRLPSFSSGGDASSAAASLGLDFKLSEPSLAALTLKQMAEQHQNMQHQKQQQQQLGTNVNPNFNVRMPFTTESFPNQLPDMGGRFHNRPAQRMQNSSTYTSMTFNAPFPGTQPIGNVFKQENHGTSSNVYIGNADVRKQNILQVSQPGVQKKGPPCVTIDRANFFRDNAPTQQMTSPQFLDGNTTSSISMPINHNQMSSIQKSQPLMTELKHVDNTQQSYSNMYNYSVAQGNNQVFQVPMSQNVSYNTPYAINSNSNMTPSDYNKGQQVNAMPNSLQMNQVHLQTIPNYHQSTGTQHAIVNSSNQWRNSRHIDMFQRQDGYGNLNCTGPIPSTIHHVTMHHPYKTVTGQMSTNRMPSPNIVPSTPSTLQNQQPNLQPHGVDLVYNNVNLSLGNIASSQLYNSQDNSQLNLDFLDNIENTASDLLNFDVMQNSSTAHFQLLEDMDILSK